MADNNQVKVVWAQQPLPEKVTKSIFLAGPTPRSADIPSWRAEALNIFKELGYDGHVYIPQMVDFEAFKIPYDWTAQVVWEADALHAADVIVFWIPRNMETLPGLTTNDEYGTWKLSGKAILGAPATATKVSYQKHYAKSLHIPTCSTLRETLEAAVAMVGPGAERHGNEVKVPYLIWKTPEFQNWYATQKKLNNRVEDVRMEWSFRVGPTMQFLFFWALRVKVFVASESRFKENEVIISRPDIASVVLYIKGATPQETKVVLVKEFRSAGCNSSGYVYELPGGSSWEQLDDPRKIAHEEVLEECGLNIDMNRLQVVGSRQLVATMSIHRAHVYACELTKEEIEFLQTHEKNNTTFGVTEDTERTYISVVKVGDLLADNLVDWSNLGMILQVVTSQCSK
eukprot:Phypoly_transcript_11098.p1 GENE.Phypoly_transcript_11098~~Phypoly_transcript_11098.p1  ORF type:complete len:408 (-),score=65.91 Phypoly_transcript_11098:24-1220(-)